MEANKKKCPPNKPLYNPKTNRCVLDNALNRKKLGLVKKTKKMPKAPKPVAPVVAPKKVCPPEKPLYNPKTNRCVLDNALNRKKLGLVKKTKKIPKAPKPVAPVVAPKPKTPKTPKAPKPVAPVVAPKKVCPPEKPLYNPKTNRCVLNNALNRKKLGMAIEPTNKVILPLQPEIVYKLPSCASRQKYPSVDLNNIDFVGPTRKGKDYSSKFTLVYIDPTSGKRTLLDKKVRIGSGAGGNVYWVGDKNNKISIALKETKSYYDTEYDIISLLKRKNVDCNILNGKIIDVSKYTRMAVFEYYNDNLTYLTGRLNLDQIVYISKQIANNFLCLYEKGMVYTDIKLHNILMKCINDTDFKITIGDVGSICLNDKKAKKEINTYPPWELQYMPGTCDSDKSVVWGWGLLVLQLCIKTYPDASRFHNLFYWANVKNVQWDSVERFVNEKCKEFKLDTYKLDSEYTLGYLIRACITKTRSSRIGLERLVKLINKVELK